MTLSSQGKESPGKAGRFRFFWISILAMTTTFFLCWRQASANKAERMQNDPGGDIDCLPCTFFRVLLFMCIGLGLLMMAGQGGSASERISAQLGLIRGDVDVVRESLSANELIDNADSADELFHNAWVWAHVRRNDKRSWDVMQELYSRFSPNKLDAAELYRSVGSAQLGGQKVQLQMMDIGRKNRDAAMLVIAARSAPTSEEALVLYAEAQVIDPEMPFTYWDVGRTDMLFYGTTQAKSLYDNTHLRIKISGLEKFIKVAERNPPVRYFYMPRYQGDYEGLARSTLESSKQLVRSREDAEKMQQESLERMRRLLRQNEENLRKLKGGGS